MFSFVFFLSRPSPVSSQKLSQERTCRKTGGSSSGLGAVTSLLCCVDSSTVPTSSSHCPEFTAEVAAGQTPEVLALSSHLNLISADSTRCRAWFWRTGRSAGKSKALLCQMALPSWCCSRSRDTGAGLSCARQAPGSVLSPWHHFCSLCVLPPCYNVAATALTTSSLSRQEGTEEAKPFFLKGQSSSGTFAYISSAGTGSHRQL